jgi:hypothetical protein
MPVHEAACDRRPAVRIERSTHDHRVEPPGSHRTAGRGRSHLDSLPLERVTQHAADALRAAAFRAPGHEYPHPHLL